MTLTESSHCLSETVVGQNSPTFNLSPPELQSPQTLVPSLTLRYLFT